MGWRPGMSKEQRARFNVGRRRRYARKRLRMGLPYTPKDPNEGLPEEENKLPTLTTEEALAVLQRIRKEEDGG